MSNQPLVEVTRGGLTESVHYGAVVVADAEGRVLAAVGDPEQRVYLRSCAKPMQALPFVEAGLADTHKLDAADLAIVCASHEGTDEHVAAVEALQTKLGIDESELQCGTHMPYDREAAAALIRAGLAPRINHHNCAGKHSGMLALARALDQPVSAYLDAAGPVQQAGRAAVAKLAGVPLERVQMAVDGCSAQTFALELRLAATCFANLAGAASTAPTWGAAARRVYEALTTHPRMVGGDGAVDTELMRAGGGAWAAKRGAEGLLGLAIRPIGTRPARGLMIKIADGDAKTRALPAVAVQAMDELGLLTEAQLHRLGQLWPSQLLNHAGQQVGELRVRPLGLSSAN